MKSALVVFSGGQDSTTCLFWAKKTFERVVALTFNYGQRHAIELEAAKQIARLAKVEHEIVDIPNILKSRSPLVDHNQRLELYSDYKTMASTIGNRVELTFVPMRNALFLTIAANHAVSQDIFDVVTGVCQEDNANYPDCRQVFIDRQKQTINEALGITNFHIHTPLMYLSKAATVALASKLPGCMEALAYSHTCYSGVYPPCGVCHSCLLRAEGFKLANICDPLIVRSLEKK